MNTTEPRSPEFMEGYRAYKPGDTLMHCPFGMVDRLEGAFLLTDHNKYHGWLAAWQDYQDRFRQFGE